MKNLEVVRSRRGSFMRRGDVPARMLAKLSKFWSELAGRKEARRSSLLAYHPGTHADGSGFMAVSLGSRAERREGERAGRRRPRGTSL